MTRKQNSDTFRAYARDNGVDIGLESKVLDVMGSAPWMSVRMAIEWIGR